MNDKLTNKRFKPVRAIIVYEEDRQYSNDYYLETRDIVRQGDKYNMMSACPIGEDTMKSIAQLYVKRNSLEMDAGGYIASHLLYARNRPGITVVMWYRQSEKRSLNFTEKLKIKSTGVIIPAMLYLVINNKLYLFALSDNDRPTLSTKLYNAPFFNVYSDGNVCLGTAKVGVRAKTFELEAERFERAFYMAEQTHGAHKDICKTPITQLWPKLIAANKSIFPKAELIQHKKYKTVGELIDKLGVKKIDNE